MMSTIALVLFLSALAQGLPNTQSTCPNLPTYYMSCGDYGGSPSTCCDGRYAEGLRSMCSHPSAEGSKCTAASPNMTAAAICNDYGTQATCAAHPTCAWSDFGCVAKVSLTPNCNTYSTEATCEAHATCVWSDFGCVAKNVCEATEYCCPDAKRCLAPTHISCAKDATACKSGQVCCPVTKICVIPGANACISPCKGNTTFCCPDAKACLAPTNPGTFCASVDDCKGGEVCCPLTKLCVKEEGACTPP